MERHHLACCSPLNRDKISVWLHHQPLHPIRPTFPPHQIKSKQRAHTHTPQHPPAPPQSGNIKNLFPVSASGADWEIKYQECAFIRSWEIFQTVTDSSICTTQTHTSTPRPHISSSSINFKPHEEVKSSHGHFHQRGTTVSLLHTQCVIQAMNHFLTSALPFYHWNLVKVKEWYKWHHTQTGNQTEFHNTV